MVDSTMQSSEDTEDPDQSGSSKAGRVRFDQNTERASSGDILSRGVAGKAYFSNLRTSSDRRLVQENHIHCIFPWSRYYKSWWGFTVFCSIVTLFFETYQIAFGTAGIYSDASSIIEYLLLAVFVADIGVNFNLAYYDDSVLVYNRKLIAKHYLRFMFWIDLIGVFPFYYVALAIAGEVGQDTQLAQYLGLLRLFKMVRVHRVRQLFEILQYSTKISLMSLTLTRNFSAALVWTHFAACLMYFIARMQRFDEDDTWIGGSVADLTGAERYVTALYWSVVTFTTVGYGDFSPVNTAEQVWGMIYMFSNIILHSWIIGSITLLIVKNDEETGFYRDSLQTLAQYSDLHSFDEPLRKRLKSQLKLDFNNREVADEEVLKNFPSSVRRKVLRQLYLPSLMQTNLMKGIRQQFIDAFLGACQVEIFSPGEEILQRGSVSSELYLLVGGTVKLSGFGRDGVAVEPKASDASGAATSVADSEVDQAAFSSRTLEAGDFLNEVSFFTETPATDTVRTLTVCKTLTMSRSTYKTIAEDHPGSVGKILQNLLDKVEEMSAAIASEPNMSLSKLNAGSMYYDESSSHATEVRHTVVAVQTEAALTAIKDVVKMHMNKLKDDHTTRFLFAASRGDTSTISLMCMQNFDPNSADYDSRTALMVAAMKGNTEAVLKILEFHANPNLQDMHGSTALYEAAKNGHKETMEVLLNHGAELCMDESQAASTLCQFVYAGDIPALERLLQAGIDANAADYDKRTAVHIAAAEGNVAALRILVKFGASLSVKDRWDNTPGAEAERAKAGHVLEYLAEARASAGHD